MRASPDRGCMDDTSLRSLADRTFEALVSLYGDPVCTLDGHEDPWHLMVGAILAAQCTDARVNLVTPALFARYPHIGDMALAEILDIEKFIRSCGLFRMKARAIQGSARMLLERYDSVVPGHMDALLSLPGIGRKIANLVLGDGFGIPGVVVDTHCARISCRIGLTMAQDPAAIEKDLCAAFPSDRWISLGHLMVTHGRNLCPAARPHCDTCPLHAFCRYAAGGSA